MKKFTLTLIAALFSLLTFAQKPVQSLKAAVPFKQNTQLAAKGIARTAAARAAAPRRLLGLVTPPAGKESETYYTTSGTFALYTGSWEDYTSQMKTIEVIVDGTDIYINGLAYYPEESWIKGTIDGQKATFPTAQQVDDDAEYPEWIQGSDDGSTLTDIVFDFDQEAGTLTSSTMYIGEAGAEDAFSLYAYWNQPTFSKNYVAPQVVELPEGVELKEYAMSYTDYSGNPASGTAGIGFNGSDVYLKGFSSYLPDALIKGTKEGNTVTFPGNQYLGTYAGYDSYFVSNAVFTYDEAADTYTAEGNVYSLLGNTYIDVYATNPVLKAVVEKAAMPANPAITGLTNSTYGYYITFNVPNVDVNGDGMVSSKLFYELFVDVEKEVSPLTFTTATHTRLTEDMTIIPFGFTENYDFYDSQIYLNELYSASWNKIGIKSIYQGGGETNETEIQWYTIKKYADEVAREALAAELTAAKDLLNSGLESGVDEFKAAIDAAQAVLDNTSATAEDLNNALAALNEAENAFVEANKDPNARQATWVAKEQEYSNGQAVDAFDIDENISATTLQNESNNPAAYYNTGTALRLYWKNSLTITANDKVAKITKIVFTTTSGSNSGSKLTADAGEYTFSGTTGTWVGDASEVTFTQSGTSGHARIQAITVEYTLAQSEDPTGITSISANKEDAGIFDLQGRRVAQPTKGLYIVNGKKVVIK